MAIRVLLDHGVQESNIIFLAFLISRRGFVSVHRAFPSVQVVTAAIDSDLHEMHFPVGNVVLGEAAGEGDYSATLVRYTSSRSALGLDTAGHGYVGETEDEISTDGLNEVEPQAVAPFAGSGLKRESVNVNAHQRNPSSPLSAGLEQLKFSRGKKEEEGVTEKRAWVISPGKRDVLSTLT